MSGKIKYQQSGMSAKVTMDMAIRDNNKSDHVCLVENYQSDLGMNLAGGGMSLELYISGRFYDPEYGYVDLDTPTVFSLLNYHGTVIAVPNREGGYTMTVENAMKFIKRGMYDDELRERLNTAPSIKVRDEILSDEGLPFSPHAFEEAFHNHLILCQQVQSADQLKEFKMWWTLLTQLQEPSAAKRPCKGCCSKPLLERNLNSEKNDLGKDI